METIRSVSESNIMIFCTNLVGTVPSPFRAPSGARCCDNCNPNLFPVDTIRLTDPNQLQLPGRSRKSPPEVFEAVQQELQVLREKFVTDLYGHSQLLITGKMILQDDIIAVLAERARSIVSVNALKQRVYWHFANQFGNDIVQAVTLVMVRFPDTVQMAKQLKDRERALKALLQMKQRDLHEKLSLIHEACLGPVLAVQDGARQVCRAFLRLPRKNVCIPCSSFL